MNAPRKKPAGEPGKATAKTKRPVAGNVAKLEAAPAPAAKPMTDAKLESLRRWADNFARRMVTAEKSDNIDPDALDIVRSISVRKYFFKHGHEASVRMYEKGGGMKNALAILSPDGLVDAERERILKAVRDFDRDFLLSLIEAMDLCESGEPGYADPKLVYVSHAYANFEHDSKVPTLAQLWAYLKKLFPDFKIDERTLRYLCKRHGLPLARDKRGRRNVIR